MKKVLPIFVIAILSILLCCKCGIAQENSERFLNWLTQDPVDMVSNVGSTDLLTLGAFGVGTSAISISDAAVSDNFQRNFRHSKLLDFSNKWGDWKIAAPVSAGIFATSLLTNDSKFQDAAFTSLQSILMTNITVNTSKFLFARERPVTENNPYNFEFVERGATSFPSGHTSTAFALFTPWMVYYPGPVTYSLMTIPVGTAIARVAKGKHWLSDVVAGAGIGFAMGYYLSQKHLKFQSNNIQITPSAGMNNVSLTVNFSF